MVKQKVIACIIARTVSTRLPLKVLREIGYGLSMLDFLIRRIKAAKSIDEIYICTSTENVDDILEDVTRRNNVKLYRGSADHVIERMLAVGKITEADVVLRITGDNPFTSYEFIDEQVNHLVNSQLDYCRLIGVPIGATAEVIRMEALIRCSKIIDPEVSEYMMLFLFEPRHFKCGVLKVSDKDYSDYSVTVDTPEDLKRSKTLLETLHKEDPEDVLLKDIIDVYENDSIVLPKKKLTLGGVIKLPYGKTSSYQAFQDDMKRRIRQSQMFVCYAK